MWTVLFHKILSSFLLKQSHFEQKWGKEECIPYTLFTEQDTNQQDGLWIILYKLLDMLTSNITMYHLMSKRQRINWFNTRGKNSLIWPIPYVSALILVLLICEFHVCKILQCSVIKKEKCLIKNTTATGWLSLFIFIHVMLEKALHILKSYGTIKAVKIQSLYTSDFYIWVNQFYIYRFIKLFDSSLWHGGFSPQFVLITAEVNEKVLQNDLQWNYVSAAVSTKLPRLSFLL